MPAFSKQETVLPAASQVNFIYKRPNHSQLISGHFKYRAGLDHTLYSIIHRDPAIRTSACRGSFTVVTVAALLTGGLRENCIW